MQGGRGWGEGGTGCAVQEGGRAVGEVRSGEHAANAEQHAVLCAALPCCPEALAATEAVDKACRFVEESGAGAGGAGVSAGGVRRRVGHVQLRGCVWAGGMSRGETPPVRSLRRNACRPPRYRLAPVQRAGDPLYVCASQPGALCGVCSL